MSGAEEVNFSLKVMVNKEKTKVVFVESDSHFVDILLSFLTLPLGRIVKVLEKHYGDEAPTIGCLNTLYNSIANLDTVHFWTEGAKKILLNPTTSFDTESRKLRLNISDSQPEYFFCGKCKKHSFWSASIYYDEVSLCSTCGNRTMKKTPVPKYQSLSDGVLTKDTTTFIITDDLLISPNAIGLVQAINILHIAETENAELMNVTFGLTEIMNLLKASMISNAPLSDLILNNSLVQSKVVVEEEEEEEEEEEDNSVVQSEESESASEEEEEEEETLNSKKKMILMVTIQKSTNLLLFAQAKEDFIEFLLSLLAIPLGGVECLLSSESNIEIIDNLYRSASNLIDDDYFKTPHMKSRLINPKLPHGYISENQILPLTEQSLPDSYKQTSLFSSLNFPQGQGNYIKGPRTYMVLDDLTVTPFYISSIICSLNQLKISVSDVAEQEIQVGLEEALSILKASLTTNCALTTGLQNLIVSYKQPKPVI